MEKNEEQPQTRYRLRSSLKKQSKNPQTKLNVSEEAQVQKDATVLPPQPRRVSFAASSSIKPFVNDPENNTIWDHTYEECINNTDSNLPLSDLQINSTKYQDVDMSLTRIEEKENIISFNTHSTITKITTTKVKPFGINTTLMKTLTDSADMELTLCEESKENMDVDKTNNTVVQDLDMSMTCKFTNPVIFAVGKNQTDFKMEEINLEPNQTSIEELSKSREKLNEVKQLCASPKVQLGKGSSAILSQSNIANSIIRDSETILEKNNSFILLPVVNQEELCCISNREMETWRSPLQSKEIPIDPSICDIATQAEMIIVNNQNKSIPNLTIPKFSLESFKESEKCVKKQILFTETNIENTLPSTSKNHNNLYETIMDQELSLIDFPNEDSINSAAPKVIYSEAMPAKSKAKPFTSFLDFTSGFTSLHSAEKNKILPSSTLDGTQQLIEATFSNKNQTNDGLNTTSMNELIQRYVPTEFDKEKINVLIKQLKDSQKLLKEHLKPKNPVAKKSKNSMLHEKVKRLSISRSSKSNDQSTDESFQVNSLELSNLFDPLKTLPEKITDIFTNTKSMYLNLEDSDVNYYVCSIFAGLVWFSVQLQEDGIVKEINVLQMVEGETCKTMWPSLYHLAGKLTVDKLQMNNLKSSLGANFDMVSMLDHVIMISEKTFDFVTGFLTTKCERFKSLDVDDNEIVSIKIILTKPATWWSIAFKMASLESIQLDSLVMTSKYDTINQEPIKTILRNTEPGTDCIRRFGEGVSKYFKKLYKVPEDIKKG